MHLPTLPLSSNSHVYTEGDVSIDPSAAIAPGVILRAAPDTKIVIAAGVCIGMGSILHAQGGTLEVEAGANLGAGVLIVGKGTIGANACIGAVTTICNASIEPWHVVPAASVVGDKGRQIVSVSSVPTAPKVETEETPDLSTSAKASVNVTPSAGVSLPLTATLNASDSGASALVGRLDTPSTSKESLNGKVPSNPLVASTGTTNDDSPVEPKAEQPTLDADKPIYGQGSLDRILKTLFPYNPSINRPPEDG
jgi:carbon dioxide concentrating mechanism protein CcmN